MNNRHQHLIVRAEVAAPPRADQCAVIEQWMRDLIRDIEMKVMFGPRAEYCHVVGNRGMTAFAIIETSHLCLHAWDEGEVPTIQLDVYTCSCLPLEVVFTALERFAPTRVEYKFLDRESCLTLVSESAPPSWRQRLRGLLRRLIGR